MTLERTKGRENTFFYFKDSESERKNKDVCSKGAKSSRYFEACLSLDLDLDRPIRFDWATLESIEK